jgi:signal transduction histidine kinase/DNA-binding response OmpR family regulator
MSTDWSQLVLLAAEFTFAVIFLRALVGYLRGRDLLQRDVTLVFTPCTALFCADVARRISGSMLPVWIGVTASIALLAQPYLTLRLAGRLRTVPRWLDRAVLVSFLAEAGLLLFGPHPLHVEQVLAVVAVFVGSELLAAALIFGKARTRTGANRSRLMTAAGATVLFALMIVLAGVSVVRADQALVTANRVLALICGLGYVVAFMPPRWLRRVFSASAAQSVTEELLSTPAESPEQVWQVYAEMMRVQTGADAVAVLMPRPDGVLASAAYAGPPIATPAELREADLTELIRGGRPARLQESDAALVAHYGDRLGEDYVTVLSMPVPPDSEGAVLLFNRHRTLFSDDDLRLLAALGGQAGILAERQAVAAEQRRMAEELSASVDALTRANQAKSAFLANMSHELRTPLNAIIGFSDLMRHEQPEADRRVVPAEWVDHIHTSGRHLLGLINDILDLAKVEAGRLDLRLGPLRVDTAMQELLTGLSPLTATKRLSVVTALAEATALADRVRFRQIMENLLSNAIKFTPEGGRITVTAVADAGTVTLTVADTGVGIAAADHAKVFEEFQQVGDADGQRGGTGLGLALTKRLIEAHGGDITLASVPGQGSSFTVRFPAAPAAGPSAPEAGGGPRVLLIEDDTQAAELLEVQLTSAGYRVQVANCGESGLSSALTDPPDAIVLDVTLPGIDGWEVFRRLKADERLAGIPVFFSTVLDERAAALALGASDYFVKPVEQADLLGALARTVAARPAPRVLVVDHDDAVRRAIEEGLRAGGADVVTCADARDGLALSRAGHFDLIVCDMQSPDVNGLDLIAAIERDPATRDTPVLGLAGAASSDRLTGDAVPLVATALVGGTAATTMAPATRREDP